jgi:hypothetical protein
MPATEERLITKSDLYKFKFNHNKKRDAAASLFE